MNEQIIEAPRGRLLGRFAVAMGFLPAIAVVLAGLLGKNAERLFGAHGPILLNDMAWTVFSLAAAIVCWVAADRLSGRERLAWRVIAIGTLLWFAGQCAWDYFELVRGRLPAFPHWMQLLFVQLPVGLTAGMLILPKPVNGRGFTMRRAANLGLVVCTFAVVFTIAVTEPATQSSLSALSIWVTLAHGSAYAVSCIVALFLLWGYRWQSAYWPLMLIVAGTAVHTAVFIFDVHRRFAGTYSAGSWLNIAWLFSFAAFACAAHEHVWSCRYRPRLQLRTLLQRERWLEATLPASMIAIMVAMAVANVDWITPQVIYICSVIGLVFAVLLGVREAWIHREEHRLIAELNESHDRLVTANSELSRSEQTVRMLNADLEQRVLRRTGELQAAYRELESFSYAVAHDIKAPLRAVNSFGALLEEEHGNDLTPQARGYIERMRRATLHMSQLVDDLLDYARIERAELQPVPTDLRALVHACVAEQSEAIHSHGTRLQTDVPPLTIAADVNALTQTLRNLLQNAIKFSQDASPPQVVIAARPEGEGKDQRVRISIADNGIGFDMQYYDRIFAMFQRLHRGDRYPGTGIGLAIARKAVERMHGRLWAESEVGKGAVFYIELPSVETTAGISAST